MEKKELNAGDIYYVNCSGELKMTGLSRAMKKLLFLSFIALMIAVACTKDDPVLPDDDGTEITNGDNTQLSDDTTLTSFSFKRALNESITKDVSGYIGVMESDNVILITVDEGVNRNALCPSFEIHEKSSLTYNGSTVENGSTLMDFSDRVELEVVAENGATETYHVICKNGIESVDSDIYEFMFKYSVPGISVAVSKNEELVYSYGYGFAILEEKELTTPEHLFRLASVSKQFTSLCIMKLIEDEQLSLDDYVFGEGAILEEEFGTSMSTRAKQVTIRHLLEHASGWMSDPVDPMFTTDPAYYGKTLEEIIAYVLANVMQPYEPGYMYSYYNLGYGMLGKVVEKLTGKNFETYLSEILSEVGITGVYVGGDQDERRENECVYYSQGGYDGYSNDLEMAKAAGGLIASAPTMMQLMARIDYGTVVPDMLEKETLDMMYTGSTSSSGKYALGWRLDHSVFSNWAAYHAGNLAGTSTIWMRGYNGVSAVILCNSRSYLSDSGGSFDDYFYTLLELVEREF